MVDGAERVRRVVDTFLELADTLANDYEVGELLQLLVDRAGELLAVDAVGVLLESADQRLQLAAANSAAMEVIEQIELDSGNGPCYDAFLTRSLVTAPDLAREQQRWPEVVPQLLEMGMRSGYGFPLKLRDDCIGALNLYQTKAVALSEDDMRLAQALADIAAVGILQQRQVAEAQERTAHLQHALSSRIIVEQAKGMLAAQDDISPDAAFDRLRRYARTHRIRLHDVCEQLLNGTPPAGL